MVRAGQSVSWVVKDDSASPNTGANVVITNVPSGVQLPADVRNGHAYGPSGTLTGTLAVPAASSVAHGVAVDATSGTATLSLEAVASLVGQQIAAAVTTPV